MAEYTALYSDGNDKPVVSYNTQGEALVCTEYGVLAVANKLSGFKGVVPRKQIWDIKFSYGSGSATEV